MSGIFGRSDAFAEVLGEETSQSIGYAAASAGDINGDGFDDLAIGTTDDDSVASENGALFLLHGPFSGSINVTQYAAKFTGTTDGDHAGWVARHVGDVNGDGIDDLVGQSHRFETPFEHSGLAFVAFGPVTGTHLMTEGDIVIHGENENEAVGLDVAGWGTSTATAPPTWLSARS